MSSVCKNANQSVKNDNDKNLLGDELNTREKRLWVRKEIPSVITDCNQACLMKRSGCGLQEVALGIWVADSTYKSSVQVNLQS